MNENATPEKKERKKPQSKPVTVVIARQNNLEIKEMPDKAEVVKFITQHVKGGAAGIKDGKGSLVSGETFVLYKGTTVTPKVKVTIN